jgi:uncharacterized membrane protein
MVGYPKWLALLVVAFVVAYLNYWMWDDARLVWGMPVNLLYHVVLSIALAPIMLVVVRRAWPRYLSDD